MMELKGKKLRVVQKYLAILKSNQKPSIPDLVRGGIGRGAMAHHFGSHGALRQAAKEYRPDAFKFIVDDDVFNVQDMDNLKALVKKHKRFVITTAVTGCKVHTQFKSAIDNYCRRTGALLLILPVADPAASAGWAMDKALDEEAIVFGDLALNSNIAIRTIKLSAKQIDPSTGLARLGSRTGSFIHGSPKQRMKMVATSNMKLPHAIMTTGAITKPNYQTNRYMSERTAYLAEKDHVMGAIIVEVENQNIYHFRQIQMDKDGSFIDLAKRYASEAVTPVSGTVFALGDYHSGETDPHADKAWLEIIDQLKVEEVIFHDLFNGLSINHHEWNNNVTRARHALKGINSLVAEGKQLATDVTKYLSKVKRATVVKSNHDEFIDRYLEEGRYMKDHINFYVAHKLVVAMMDGHDPLRWLAEHCGLKSDRVNWLNRDQDYKVFGIQCGAHGDKGANGSRGTLKMMEESYVSSVTAHRHSPEILREAWCLGTSSLLKLPYNKGSSSWFHTSCLIYPGGLRQMINVIGGKWKV
jgi:hypothetical protein